MNIYLLIILIALIGKYLLDLITDIFNIRHASPNLPEEFQGYYDADKYRKSQAYLKENTYFDNFKGTISIIITLIFILAGGFNAVDKFARGYGYGEIITGLIFAALLMLAVFVYAIPFSIYDTFLIEEKYGFNKTTPKTFVLDLLKSMVLGAIIGGIVFTIILWFFSATGKWAWVYCWIAVTLFQFILLFIAPVIILPLFNKFTPLEQGELKNKIEDYTKQENYKLKGIYKIDASKRSTKTNAYFTGFGKYKRIALYDTLIARHTVDEIVSILAHEVGHYKKKHIVKEMLLGVIITGVMFFILSLFIKNRELFDAFKMEQTSIYASLFFFGFLFTPINMILSVVSNIISRKHEYEADAFSARTFKKPDASIESLKKLTVDNLGNLTPHPLMVFMHYSHPPVLERIQALRKFENSLSASADNQIMEEKL